MACVAKQQKKVGTAGPLIRRNPLICMARPMAVAVVTPSLDFLTVRLASVFRSCLAEGLGIFGMLARLDFFKISRVALRQVGCQTNSFRRETEISLVSSRQTSRQNAMTL